MPAEFGGGVGWFAMALSRRQATTELNETVSNPHTHTKGRKESGQAQKPERLPAVSPVVFHSDIFDVARQNMCCDIIAVNSLSPCLNVKTKK